MSDLGDLSRRQQDYLRAKEAMEAQKRIEEAYRQAQQQAGHGSFGLGGIFGAQPVSKSIPVQPQPVPVPFLSPPTAPVVPTVPDFGAQIAGQLVASRQIDRGADEDRFRVPTFEEREAERARMADHFRKNGVL